MMFGNVHLSFRQGRKLRIRPFKGVYNAFLPSFVKLPSASYDHDNVIKWDIFRVTGPLCEEFAGHWWIPTTKDSDAEQWCFWICALNKWLSKQSWGWWFEAPSRSLAHHYNDSLGCRALEPVSVEHGRVSTQHITGSHCVVSEGQYRLTIDDLKFHLYSNSVVTRLCHENLVLS